MNCKEIRCSELRLPNAQAMDAHFQNLGNNTPLNTLHTSGSDTFISSQSSSRASSYSIDSRQSPKKLACDECRRVRKKCDKGKPTCNRCASRDYKCEYTPPVHTRQSKIRKYGPLHGSYIYPIDHPVEATSITADDALHASSFPRTGETYRSRSWSPNDHTQSEVEHNLARLRLSYFGANPSLTCSVSALAPQRAFDPSPRVRTSDMRYRMGFDNSAALLHPPAAPAPAFVDSQGSQQPWYSALSLPSTNELAQHPYYMHTSSMILHMDRSDISEGTHAGDLSYVRSNNAPQSHLQPQPQCTSGAQINDGMTSDPQQLLEAFHQFYGTSPSYNYKMDHAVADPYQHLAQDMTVDGTPQIEMLAESGMLCRPQSLRVAFERYPDPGSEKKASSSNLISPLHFPRTS